MYVDSCLFWEGTVLLSNSLIPQIREILDFRARNADASLEHISSLISEEMLSLNVTVKETPTGGGCIVYSASNTLANLSLELCANTLSS